MLYSVDLFTLCKQSTGGCWRDIPWLHFRGFERHRGNTYFHRAITIRLGQRSLRKTTKYKFHISYSRKVTKVFWCLVSEGSFFFFFFFSAVNEPFPAWGEDFPTGVALVTNAADQRKWRENVFSRCGDKQPFWSWNHFLGCCRRLQILLRFPVRLSRVGLEDKSRYFLGYWLTNLRFPTSFAVRLSLEKLTVRSDNSRKIWFKSSAVIVCDISDFCL